MNKQRDINEDPPQQLKREILLDMQSSSYDVNAVDDSGDSDLMVAAHIGSISLINEILKKNPNPNIINHSNENIMHYLVYLGESGIMEHKIALEILDIMKDKEINLNVIDLSGCTPLGLACSFGNHEIVKKFIELGADVHCSKPQNEPLFLACCNDSVKSIYALCMTADTPEKIAAFEEEIKDCEKKDYANQILNSLRLNFNLEKKLSQKTKTTTAKI